MSDEAKCTRCGADVPAVLSPPPDERNTWYRYRVSLRSVAVTHTLRFRIFTRKWLPERAGGQLRETYTEFDLCDPCARDVLRFAQTPAFITTFDLIDRSSGCKVGEVKG